LVCCDSYFVIKTVYGCCDIVVSVMSVFVEQIIVDFIEGLNAPRFFVYRDFDMYIITMAIA